LAFNIRYVLESDRALWFTLDEHLSEQEFELKIRDNRGYIINDGERPVGEMRYNLMWDNTPFLTHIYLEESSRGKGFGRRAMLFWEREMREIGYNTNSS
jgi:GNAT superfamily N-acetyltransferase